MKHLYIVIFLMCTNFFVMSEIKQKQVETSLLAGTGIAYNFNFSKDMLTGSDKAFFNIPLSFDVVFRLNPSFSISTGISLLYNYHLYTLSEFEVTKHSLLIDIPFDMRFYPLALRESTHYNFYIIAGFFLRTWPLQFYQMRSKTQYFEGNGYSPNNNFIQPANGYSFINVGTQFGIGNVFMFTNDVGGGLEITAKYTFIPFIYSEKLLNFWGSIGIKAFLQFRLSQLK